MSTEESCGVDKNNTAAAHALRLHTQLPASDDSMSGHQDTNVCRSLLPAGFKRPFPRNGDA